jgi:hypothetical protein
VAARPLALRQAAWVLPGHIGHGPALPIFALPQLLHDSDQLAQFSVKTYLDTVKGYLDGAGKYALAAAALCLRGTPPHATPGERFGVVAVSQYGAPGSGFDFYQQLRTKGPRLASPLIFPHGYANTAPNLVAIEFGLAGPHLVLNNATDLAEAWWIATHLLQRGLADDVLLLATEAVRPTLVPDGWPVLNGALAWWLTSGPGEPLPTAPLQLPDNRAGTLAAALA